MTKRKQALFLFEHTGLAAMAFTQAGWKTYIVDTLNTDINKWASVTLDLDILAFEDYLAEIAADCQFVFGFPPCTDLTVAGAGHFAAKAKRNPNFQLDAVHLCRSVERIGNKAQVAWALENPISCLSTIWRKPDFKFDPYEYGGYLPPNDVHPLWPDHIMPRDGYPKKTCLWIGNGFKIPPKKPLDKRLAYSEAHLYLGGKSEKTKKIRSASPRGFFKGLQETYDAET